MGKTIHPLPNFDVDPAVRNDNFVKVVIDNDFVRDDVETEMHVLGIWHGSVEVEISKIDAQKLGPTSQEAKVDLIIFYFL